MPKSEQIEVKDLLLDLKNYRTTPQKTENEAIKAMISIKPDRFFAIMESIIDDGYLHTENIIVLDNNKTLTVKEGNRRIASLKLILNYANPNEFGIPTSILTKISQLDNAWKNDNIKVPCTIYDASEVDKVDKIVTLAHGKGEKASRDPWNSVARARHNRDVNRSSEPALDILEKYLKNGKNLTGQQIERWGGEYPITVLEEALRKIYPRFNTASIVDLVTAYPKIPLQPNLEDVMRDIGLELLDFKRIRDSSNDFGVAYGITPIQINSPSSSTQGSSSQPSNSNVNTAPSNTPNNSQNSTTPQVSGSQSQSQGGTHNTTTTPTNTNSGAVAAATAGPSTQSSRSYATNDSKYVSKLLKKFIPRGNNRQKVVTLRDELKKLKISDNPIAFCFVLRSMFEISAKAYCNDNSISLTKLNGNEKKLVEILKEVTAHLTNNNSNTQMLKVLHGALTEISKSDGLLSVTSMNQLVHNPSFSIIPSDICILFSNVYPLLEAMN